jgi:hypothetical protein
MATMEIDQLRVREKEEEKKKKRREKEEASDGEACLGVWGGWSVFGLGTW